MIAADTNTDTDRDQRGGGRVPQVGIIDQDDPDPVLDLDLVIDIRIFFYYNYILLFYYYFIYYYFIIIIFYFFIIILTIKQ